MRTQKKSGINACCDAAKAVHAPECAWLGEELMADVKSGDHQAMLWAIGNLARALMDSAGFKPDDGRIATRRARLGHILRRTMPQSSLGEATLELPEPVRIAFLAAGCELLEILALSPGGRKALCDFGFQPIAQDAEAEG